MDFEGGGREAKWERISIIRVTRNNFFYLLESHLRYRRISLASDERMTFNKSRIQHEG